jgi:hypothetical protein
MRQDVLYFVEIPNAIWPDRHRLVREEAKRVMRVSVPAVIEVEFDPRQTEGWETEVIPF